MKTIGVLGGMSWESTAVYYRRLNEIIQESRGGVASASLILHSFDFEEIEQLQHQDRWEDLGKLLSSSARALRSAGADFLLIATNTMHLLADRIEAESGLPVLHIADAVSRHITNRGFKRVALLGTKFTMERPFYAERIASGSGAEVLTPEAADREAIHSIIYNELCCGVISENSRATVVTVIDRLAGSGAECAILGCTELPLLVKAGDASVPVVDSVEVHVQEAARLALSSQAVLSQSLETL